MAIVVRPWPTNWPEHVATQNPCANIAESTSSKVIIGASGTAAISEHFLESLGWECPFVQRMSSSAKWVFKILVRPCTESVDGYGETLYS